MRKFTLILLPLCLILAVIGCQKEKSQESSKNPSTGTLASDVSGDCLPKNVSGVYEVGVALKPDSNYIEVQIDVTVPGSYVIATDTVNGIFFRGTGVFLNKGLNTIKIKGTGTPIEDGFSNFIVSYGTTSCVVSVAILPAGAGGPAVFTLLGSPNVCMTATVLGDYVVGVQLSALNTVTIDVDVTTIGGYNITTVVSNGVTFSGIGTLALRGKQTITLTATGTPVIVGTTNVPVTAGNSVCNFEFEVLATEPLNDYFPLTTGSNWSYEFDNDPEDSFITKVVPGLLNVAGNSFTVFEASSDEANIPLDTLHTNRKSGNDYIRYTDLSDYLFFGEDHYGEFTFLKDNQPKGFTWTSGETTGTVGGTPASLRFKFTIIDKGIPLTVTSSTGPKTYPNVIVVEESYQFLAGTTWVDANIGTYRDYYARGVGLVKDEEYVTGTTTPDQIIALRRSQVFP